MEKQRYIYIFGHKNPDTDSTCAAIAYAYLKNILDQHHTYIPIVLGDINRETKYVLKHFNVESPRKMSHLKSQVSDIDLTKSYYLQEQDSIRKALETIVGQTGRSVPVVDKNERLIGIISISDIIPTYLQANGNDVLKINKTPFKNLIEGLKLELYYGKIKNEYVEGNIYLYSDINEELELTDQDIVICDLKDVVDGFAFSLGAGYILIANINEKINLDLKDTINCTIMISPKMTYELVKSTSQTIPITEMVKKYDLEYFTTYETLDDVKENMLTSQYRRFPVVDEWGCIQGMISRSNLVEIHNKKAILVDHNERSQSINGIEDVTILEVIDHHRVADIQTMAPLYFRVEPVGCTCTIIAKLYEENNIEIPKEMAGIMLSAILSDTLLFKSPTCTSDDRETAMKLSKISNVHIQSYGMKMLIKGTSLHSENPESIITKDMKKFMFGKYKVMISQINTGDFKGFYHIQNDIIKVMNQKCEEEGYALVVLMVTDIIIGGTELLATGNAKWIADNAFNMRKEDGSIFLNGVFSRKKQVVPKLMQAAKL